MHQENSDLDLLAWYQPVASACQCYPKSSCIFCYLSNCQLLVGGKKKSYSAEFQTQNSKAKCVVAKDTELSKVKVFAININQWIFLLFSQFLANCKDQTQTNGLSRIIKVAVISMFTLKMWKRKCSINHHLLRKPSQLSTSDFIWISTPLLFSSALGWPTNIWPFKWENTILYHQTQRVELNLICFQIKTTCPLFFSHYHIGYFPYCPSVCVSPCRRPINPSKTHRWRTTLMTQDLHLKLSEENPLLSVLQRPEGSESCCTLRKSILKWHDLHMSRPPEYRKKGHTWPDHSHWGQYRSLWELMNTQSSVFTRKLFDCDRWAEEKYSAEVK